MDYNGTEFHETAAKKFILGRDNQAEAQLKLSNHKKTNAEKRHDARDEPALLIDRLKELMGAQRKTPRTINR